MTDKDIPPDDEVDAEKLELDGDTLADLDSDEVEVRGGVVFSNRMAD